MQGILESFSLVLKHIDPEGQAVEAVVFAAWKQCVSGILAENIVPVQLKGDRLIAAVSSVTWRRNVADLGPELAAKINRTLGSALLSYIEFRVDAEAVAEHRRQRQPVSGISANQDSIAEQLAPGLLASAETIADEGLRMQFVAAAAANLARSDAKLSGGTET